MSIQKLEVKTCPTKPIEGQKPGTSGLRKPTRTFLEPGYTENFIQAILTAATSAPDRASRNLPTKLVLGGDGRYFVDVSLRDIIIPMCAANGVTEVIVGQSGILSTPAASYLIRQQKAQGGIILTASHNPGGIDADFGIKYNVDNGGPAPEKVTDEIYIATTKITEYKTLTAPLPVDITRIGEHTFPLPDGKNFKVSIVSSTQEYCNYMEKIFDFPSIRKILTGSDGKPPFKIIVSGLNGVMGPYIKHVLCQTLGLSAECALKAESLPDFGGGHPDPNLTYAADLVEKMRNDSSIGLAAAFDGDGDRNMLIGRDGFFLSPCDSLALIASHSNDIRYFREQGMHGVARSMPTSRALDKVCEALGIPIYEVPTGWKFFGNLMDANLCSLCGEESFGTGSNHIREKDGLWALLSWLSILAARRAANASAEVKDLMYEHWSRFGRYFFTRYDYENCESSHGTEMMKRLEVLLSDPKTVGRSYAIDGCNYVISQIDNYSYTDPVDKSVSKNQGIRVFMNNGARLVFRLSGTGSQGSTLRIYVDSYEADKSKHTLSSQEYLSGLIKLAIELSGVAQITGRQAPTVIT